MTPTHYPAFSVLLVDDEPAWLHSLALTLERSAGITHLQTCSDSRQVMALLDRSTVGLVLLDLTMPHLSGEQLLAQIAERHPEITVIVISGLNQVESGGAVHQARRLRLLRQDGRGRPADRRRPPRHPHARAGAG